MPPDFSHFRFTLLGVNYTERVYFNLKILTISYISLLFTVSVDFFLRRLTGQPPQEATAYLTAGVSECKDTTLS